MFKNDIKIIISIKKIMIICIVTIICIFIGIAIGIINTNRNNNVRYNGSLSVNYNFKILKDNYNNSISDLINMADNLLILEDDKINILEKYKKENNIEIVQSIYDKRDLFKNNIKNIIRDIKELNIYIENNYVIPFENINIEINKIENSIKETEKMILESKECKDLLSQLTGTIPSDEEINSKYLQILENASNLANLESKLDELKQALEKYNENFSMKIKSTKVDNDIDNILKALNNSYKEQTDEIFQICYDLSYDLEIIENPDKPQNMLLRITYLPQKLDNKDDILSSAILFGLVGVCASSYFCLFYKSNKQK